MPPIKSLTPIDSWFPDAASVHSFPRAPEWTAPPHLGDRVDRQNRSAGAGINWPEIYSDLRSNPNDSAAFSALERGVTKWAERQLGSKSSRRRMCRDDLIADTCAAVVLGIDSAYGAETFKGFVYGHYLNARRQAIQILDQPVVPLGDLDIAQSDELAPTSDELSLLARCLGELPDRERRAIELRYFHDATSREIAQTLGVTDVNARRIVFNGLTRLRRRVGQEWPLGR